jgi:aminoglycoside phosphotransferase family enzyme
MPQLEIIFSETTKKMLETLAEEFAKGKLSPEKSDKFAKTLVSRWHKYTEMKTLLKVKSGKTKEKEVKKTSMDFLKELRKKTGKKKKVVPVAVTQKKSDNKSQIKQTGSTPF